MVAYYVMGTVIAKSPYLGKEYVGLLAAVVVLYYYVCMYVFMHVSCLYHVCIMYVYI